MSGLSTPCRRGVDLHPVEFAVHVLASPELNA